jgi:hypothetical protein
MTIRTSDKKIDIFPELNAIAITENKEIAQIFLDKIFRISVYEDTVKISSDNNYSYWVFPSFKEANSFRYEINDAILKIISIRNKKSFNIIGGKNATENVP